MFSYAVTLKWTERNGTERLFPPCAITGQKVKTAAANSDSRLLRVWIRATTPSLFSLVVTKSLQVFHLFWSLHIHKRLYSTLSEFLPRRNYQEGIVVLLAYCVFVLRCRHESAWQKKENECQIPPICLKLLIKAVFCVAWSWASQLFTPGGHKSNTVRSNLKVWNV